MPLASNAATASMIVLFFISIYPSCKNTKYRAILVYSKCTLQTESM